VNRGDIYLVPLDPTADREQAGTRLGFAVEITGIPTTGIIRCDQPRTLDLAARNARKLSTLPAPILSDVMAKLATIRS
jgi:mRNA interferase ChpB